MRLVTQCKKVSDEIYNHLLQNRSWIEYRKERCKFEGSNIFKDSCKRELERAESLRIVEIEILAQE